MANGHSWRKPSSPELAAAGFRIWHAPHINGGHLVYWWARGDEIMDGCEALSARGAENDALEHLRAGERRAAALVDVEANDPMDDVNYVGHPIHY